MEVQQKILKLFRKLYKAVYSKEHFELKYIEDCDTVSKEVFEELMKDKPSMIARFGAFELATMVNYKGVKKEKKNWVNYIKGQESDWWWNQSLIKYMHENAGFFPPTVAKIEQFSQLMFQDTKQLDILGSWQLNEKFVQSEIAHSLKVSRGKIDPFWAEKPWTHALEGKKVLVIHPFVKTIASQYQKRELLFKNNLLPEFELKTIKAVQTITGMPTEFEDWFEALESMKQQMNDTDYDICLIGAGAYGFPLAAHAKRSGKKSVHIGGSLQLLFGIRGNRWDNEKVVGKVNYQALFNEHWVRPLEEETPTKSKSVEGGAYW